MWYPRWLMAKEIKFSWEKIPTSKLLGLFMRIVIFELMDTNHGITKVVMGHGTCVWWNFGCVILGVSRWLWKNGVFLLGHPQVASLWEKNYRLVDLGVSYFQTKPLWIDTDECGWKKCFRSFDGLGILGLWAKYQINIDKHWLVNIEFAEDCHGLEPKQSFSQ